MHQWFGTLATKKDIQKLEMVQRRAVRFIFSKFRSTDSPTKLMKDNDIPVLEDRRRIARLKFLHSIYNGKLNIPAHKYIQPFSPRASRHRHMHNLLPYTTRTNTFKNSFFPRTIIQWNSLPPDVVSSDDFEKALLGASQPWHKCTFSVLLVLIIVFMQYHFSGLSVSVFVILEAFPCA